ncbi:MAG: MFS transporter [Promethearchaeota archaeon]|jgi:GPH family glycoside/pentoside/hexuronide:cation symporter
MTESAIIDGNESSTRKYLLFGLPRLSTSILIGFADFALFSLYKLAYLPSAFLIGTALALGKLTIAISQFFFGWISDAVYTKWGRRKPFLIFLSPVLSISFLFLLVPPLVIDITNTNTTFIWLLVWNVLFNFSYGITSPYGSWMAEQFNFNNRPKASQYYNIFSFIGSSIMFIFSFFILTSSVDIIAANPNSVPPVFLFTVIVFSILPVILFYLATILIPTEPYFKIESKIFDNLKTIVKNKNFILATLMQAIASIAFIMIGQTILQFTEIVLQFENVDYYIVAGLMMFGIFGFIYLWRKIIEKIGKKRSLLYIFLISIIFLPSTLFGIISMDSSLVYGILFVLGIAASMGGWNLLPSIIYADIAEDDQKRTGELKAGIYTGFPSIILNIFQALGLFLMGIMFDLPKFGLDFSIGYILWGPVSSLILICAYFYTRKFVKLDFQWEKTRTLESQ